MILVFTVFLVGVCLPVGGVHVCDECECLDEWTVHGQLRRCASKGRLQ